VGTDTETDWDTDWGAPAANAASRETEGPDAASGPLAVGAAGLAHGGTDGGHLGRALLGERGRLDNL